MKKVIIYLILIFVCYLSNATDYLRFEKNKGQWDRNILYQANLSYGKAMIRQDRLTFVVLDTNNLSFHNPNHFEFEDKHKNNNRERYHIFSIVPINANQSTIEQDGQMSGYANYFIGKDKTLWQNKVYSYQEVMYKNIYNNIDWKIYSEKSLIKHSFVVHRGGHVSDISLDYRGVKEIYINKGHLIIKTSVGEIIEEKPFVFQKINGTIKEIVSQYVINKGIVSYKIGQYDKDYDLIIDPTLIFSTYSGSHSDNWGFTSCFDLHGNMISAGICSGQMYPTTEGAYDTVFSGNWDCVISKFDGNGENLYYSTYLGGLRADLPHSMIVNQYDELLVLGTTGSINFPTTTGAYQEFFNGGDSLNYETTIVFPNGVDMFISRLSRDGDSLLSSTFIGGSGNDGLNYRNSYGASYQTLYNGNDTLYANYGDCARGELITDKHNNVYVGSCTFSNDFPTTPNAFQTTFSGQQDGVVFKLDPSLSTLLYSSYIGGTKADAVYSIDIDKDNRLYVCGGTSSTNFPTTSGAYNTTYNGGQTDGFLSVVSVNGTQLLASTYFGSDKYDQAYFVRLDKNNYPHIYGQTKASGSTLVKNALYNIPNSGQFIAKMTPMLDSVVWSTVFGTGDGRINISPSGFAVDVCNRIYCAGWGRVFKYIASALGYNTLGTTNMQVTSDAYSNITDGQDFYIMSLSSDAASLDYATFFGEYSTNKYVGTDHVDGGTSRFDRYGNLYQTVCSSCGGSQSFPTTANAWSDSNGSANCNIAAFKFSIHNDFAVADFTTPNIVCVDSVVHFNNLSRGDSFQWFFSDGTTSTQTNPTHTYSHGGVYVVKLISHLNYGCISNDTIQKQIIVLNDSNYSLPQLTTCPQTPIAIGLDYFLTDPSVTFSWTPSNVLTNPNSINPYATITSPTTFRLIITTPSCFDTIYQHVAINYLDVDLQDTLYYCSLPYDYTIPNNENRNIILSWNRDFSETLPFDNHTNDFIINDTIGRYLYVKYYTDNCFGIDSIYLKYNGGTINIQTTDAGCSSTTNGTATAFISNFHNNVHYHWSCSTIDDNYVESLPVGNYTLTVTDGNGCSVTKEFSIGSVTNLTTSFEKRDNPCDEVCKGEIVLNIHGGQSPYTLLWNNNSNDTIQKNLCTGKYTYILTDYTGCVIKDTITIKTIDTLQLKINHTDNVCPSGCSAIATAEVSNGTEPYQYLWSNGEQTKEINNLCSGKYSLIVKDSNECQKSDSINITYVNVLNNFSVSVSSTQVYDGATITLSSTELNGFNYYWTPSANLSSPNSPTTEGKIYETTTYIVYVTDNKGCSLTDSVHVDVTIVNCGKPNIYVPNVFTPNGDEKNDKIFVTGQWIQTMDFAIYNRWGEKVFQTKDMSIGWDGNYKNNPCQAGVYYYKLSVQCYGGKTYTTGGDITLLR